MVYWDKGVSFGIMVRAKKLNHKFCESLCSNYIQQLLKPLSLNIENIQTTLKPLSLNIMNIYFYQKWVFFFPAINVNLAPQNHV